MKWIGNQPAEAFKVERALQAAHGTLENAPPSKSTNNRFDRDYAARIVQWGGFATSWIRVASGVREPFAVRNAWPIGSTEVPK